MHTGGETNGRFPDDHPTALVNAQQKHWEPLFTWLREEYGIELHLAEGFSPAKQDPETIKKLNEIVGNFDIYTLAAFERAVYSSKSFVIALALVMGRISADEAAHAAQVEVRSQIEQWGEVEDSELREPVSATSRGRSVIALSLRSTRSSAPHRNRY